MIGFIVPYYFPAGTIDQVRDQVLLFLNTIFDEEVANNLVGNTVETILGQGQADVVSIGLVISLWAGSSAMSAFVESITIAYNQHEVRHPVAERFFALGLYLIALFAGIVMLPLLAIGPGLPAQAVPGVLARRGVRHRQLRLLPGDRARPDLHADRAVQGRARNTNTPGTGASRGRCWPPPSSSWPASGCGCTCPTSTRTA